MQATIRPPTRSPRTEEQVRALGYDPRHLTPREQEELLELYRLFAEAEKRR